jgi:hypothetical protein
MTLVSVPNVAAKDMRGKLGIGANSTLTNAQGLTVRYWPTRRLGVEILAGASVARGSDQGDRIGVAFAAQLSYVLREIGRANLIIGIRGVLAYVNDDSLSQSPDTVDGGPDISNSFLHPAVEAPLTIEYHFSDAFSLQLATGLALSFVPKEGALLTGGRIFTSLHEASSDRNYETVLGIGGGGLFGSAGFTFYF